MGEEGPRKDTHDFITPLKSGSEILWPPRFWEDHLPLIMSLIMELIIWAHSAFSHVVILALAKPELILPIILINDMEIT